MDTTSKDTSWLAEDLRIGKLLSAGELKECKQHLSASTTGSDFDSHTSYLSSLIYLTVADMQTFIQDNFTSARERHKHMPTSMKHWTRPQIRRGR